MRPSHIVLKELMNRKSELLASFLAILLAIAIIVSVRTISVSSSEKIRQEMHNLGSNMLIIPEKAKVSNYYTADFGNKVMPEKYVHILNTSKFSEKVHEMIPKLSSRFTIGGHRAILTGVLPKDEFKTKPEWRLNNLFFKSKENEKKVRKRSLSQTTGEDVEPILRYEEKKVKRKAFDSLGSREAILGSEIARLLNLREGQILDIEGRQFTPLEKVTDEIYDKNKTIADGGLMLPSVYPVRKSSLTGFTISRVFEQTGTVDDIRVFLHLHTVQDILGKGRMINAIEVVGCGCRLDLIKLGKDIERILPGTRVITIKNIAETQGNTIKMMENFSLLLLIIILIIGGATIANYMSANVHERRREIGTLLAIGATPRIILSIFLQKAIFLGLVGGFFGYFAGTGLAILLGPKVVKASISPQPFFFFWSLAIAVFLNTVFSLIPVKKAARLDPACVLQEE